MSGVFDLLNYSDIQIEMNMFKLMQERMDLGYKLSSFICIKENCQSNLLIHREEELAFCAKCDKIEKLQTILDFLNSDENQEEEQKEKAIETTVVNNQNDL